MAAGSSVSYLSVAKAATARLLGWPVPEAKSGKRAKKKGWRIDEPKISQSLEQVAARLREDRVKRVLVQGDRTFLDQFKAALPEVETRWASPDFREVADGALNPDAVDYAEVDAAVCGGALVAVGYRHAVSRMAETHPDRPVHWVAENWEYCAGTMPLPAGIDDCEALCFNHFQNFFAIKDPLQFRFEILHGSERKHFYRILKPNESILVRLSDFFPKVEHAACIAAYVSHPILTRGRHYRYRSCADIHWRDSFTTLHSAHQFNMSPDYGFEYRLPRSMLRAGEVALTVPNYARDLGENRDLRYTDGGAMQSRPRDPAKFIEESRLSLDSAVNGKHFGWEYKGYGGSFWYTFEPETALADGKRGSLASNHYQSVPIEERTEWAAEPAETERFAKLQEAGYIVTPYSIPLTRGKGELRFGFETDGSNPGFDQFLIYWFDASGALLGKMPYHKTTPGPVFPDDILATWSDPARDRAAMAVVTPDWVKNKLRFARLKDMTNLFVENARTRDRDVTEFQTSWRNCGVFVEGFAHFAGPTATVFGRTNLFGRARQGGGCRTAVLAVNGSGWLGHKAPAHLELIVRNMQGDPVSGMVEIPAFCWKLIWLDELIPGLQAHLGDGGFGPLLAQSADGDLNCQLVTVNDKGAVSLQHLWGY